MIFQHTLNQILDATKTQSRRLWVAGDYTWINGERPAPERAHRPYRLTYSQICHADGSVRYEVGKTYAVQPGRGKHAVARIKIVSLWREHVQEISPQDVYYEGIRCADFFASSAMRSVKGATLYGQAHVEAYAKLWNSIHVKTAHRWGANPLVVCIEFVLVD